jgi:hypothetical protein
MLADRAQGAARDVDAPKEWNYCSKSAISRRHGKRLEQRRGEDSSRKGNRMQTISLIREARQPALQEATAAS